MRLLDHLRRLLWWLPFGRVDEIPADELARRLAGDDPPQVVDVRTVLEWRDGHVPGAVHVPVRRLQRELAALDRRRPVVAVCLTAHRSIPAVRLLEREGFVAAQLAGGMRAWRDAGLPTTVE